MKEGQVTPVYLRQHKFILSENVKNSLCFDVIFGFQFLMCFNAVTS